MTIIEMLLAISIFTMGIAGFTLLFSRTWKVNSYSIEMGQASMTVSRGLGEMVSFIRGARQADNGSYAIKSASSNDFVVYSDFDKDSITERLHFYKSGQDVLMGITDPTATMPKTYPSEDQSTLAVAKYIVNNASTPIFYYYDKDFAGDEAGDPPLAVPVLDVSKVRLVKIYLQINIMADRAPDNIEMKSFVEMRNLNDYNRVH